MVIRMKKLNGIFVTGTDTGVGKTIVSAALLCALRNRGVDAVYMKPVQTGCRRRAGKLSAPDLEEVCKISGINPPEAEKKIMAPCRFRLAASPHLAAALEKRNIRIPEIMKAFARLKSRHDFVITEGAGGILAPLTRKKTMLDLARALKLPVIVVARPGLGTINHTLLTLRELRRSKLEVLGVIINHAARGRKTIVEKDNLATIARLGKTRIMAELPFIRKSHSRQH